MSFLFGRETKSAALQWIQSRYLARWLKRWCQISRYYAADNIHLLPYLARLSTRFRRENTLLDFKYVVTFLWSGLDYFNKNMNNVNHKTDENRHCALSELFEDTLNLLLLYLMKEVYIYIIFVFTLEWVWSLSIMHTGINSRLCLTITDSYLLTFLAVHLQLGALYSTK